MSKKKWQVIKNTTNPEFTGLDLDGKKVRFGRSGTFVVDAPNLARDIDKTYGRKGNQSVAVVPYNDHETREQGHNYTFTGVDTSHFRVWVIKRGKLVRVTKAQAHKRGYKIVSTSKKRPELMEVRNDENKILTRAGTDRSSYTGRTMASADRSSCS